LRSKKGQKNCKTQPEPQDEHEDSDSQDKGLHSYDQSFYKRSRVDLEMRHSLIGMAYIGQATSTESDGKLVDVHLYLGDS